MTSLQTVLKEVQLNGEMLGSVADLQGEDATSSLLLQVTDRMVLDSTEDRLFVDGFVRPATALV